MKRTKSFLKLRAGPRSGQAMIEYIILLSIIVGVVAYFLSKMTSSFDVTTAKYGGAVERQLRTGSAPATIWKK